MVVIPIHDRVAGTQNPGHFKIQIYYKKQTRYTFFNNVSELPCPNGLIAWVVYLNNA